MKKFGNLQNIDSDRDELAGMNDIDLVKTDDEVIGEDPSLSDVDIVNLPNTMTTAFKEDKPKAASGNKPKEIIDIESDPYPALEFGGMGIKTEFSRRLTEAFNGTVDESPYDDARSDREKNIIDKTQDMFKTMFGAKYTNYVEPKKNPKIDHDFTQPKVTLKGVKEMFNP